MWNKVVALIESFPMVYCTPLARKGIEANSWLLMVGNQIVNSIPGLSFGHNLCFNCPNGSCNPILDIYVPRTFRRYKKLFNPMSFDPYNHSLNIQESIWTPTPKVRAHLGVWGFIPESMRCDSRASFLACTLASPCFGHGPKARVTIRRIFVGPWLFNYEKSFAIAIYGKCLVQMFILHLCLQVVFPFINIFHDIIFNLVKKTK
jgi:hypothetical protein